MTDPATEDWDGATGERWLGHIDAFESMIGPIGEALVARAGFAKGERVADIGCGGGATTVAIGQAIGSEGHATGVDISPMLLDEARKRAKAVGNVDFVVANAQEGQPEGAPFDRLFSRFGIMFFRDTGTAFANMRGWLKPGGDFTFACWAPVEQNPWVSIVGAVASKHVEMPEREPDAPGPFRLADETALRAMLESAGYADIAIDGWTGEQNFGGEGADPETAAEFAVSALGVSEPLREQGGEVLMDQVRSDLKMALEPYYRDGSVRMPGKAWLVTARNPG